MLNSRAIGVVLVSVLLCSGCFLSKRVTKTMDSWVGAPQAKLIRSWGPPTRTASDGAGGTILIYEYDRDTGQTAVRMFYVDPSGTIYYWRWKGL